VHNVNHRDGACIESFWRKFSAECCEFSGASADATLIQVREEVPDPSVHHSVVVLAVTAIELVQLAALTLGEIDHRLLDRKWQPQLDRVAIPAAAVAGGPGRGLGGS
jgi:hypothetical protein